MPDDDVDSLLALAPSEDVAGYRMTVAEARALPGQLFSRMFDYACLDDVPVVARGLSGPGIFDDIPAGVEQYIWLRPPPDPARRRPGGKAGRKAAGKAPKKARKKAAFVLVRKIPKERRAAAGGRERIFRTLRAASPDEARLEVLLEAARAKNRTIRPATWPVERIVALSARHVLEVYLVKNGLRARKDGKESVRRKKRTRENLVRAVETFREKFSDSLIGDLEGEWIADEYEIRTGCEPTTRYADLKSVKKGLRGGLALLGVRDWRIGFDNPDPGRLEKMPWTPGEYDAILAAAHGWKTLPDGTRVPSETGGYRGQWQRGIPFLTRTASRHGILPNVRWVGPWVEPDDGLPLPLPDRAWIEVTDGPIYFHRDGGMPYDGNKGRAGNIIPEEFAPEVRAWFEADMAVGRQFVFRRKNGMRYVGRHIGWWTFRRIVADSGVPWQRVPHHFKDFAKEIAEASGLRVEAFAAHADTAVEMLEGTYGDATRAALLQEAAEKHSLSAWREKDAARLAIVERFRRNRARADQADAEAAKTGPRNKPRTEAQKQRRLERDRLRRAAAAETRSCPEAAAAKGPGTGAAPAPGRAARRAAARRTG